MKTKISKFKPGDIVRYKRDHHHEIYGYAIILGIYDIDLGGEPSSRSTIKDPQWRSLYHSVFFFKSAKSYMSENEVIVYKSIKKSTKNG